MCVCWVKVLRVFVSFIHASEETCIMPDSLAGSIRLQVFELVASKLHDDNMSIVLVETELSESNTAKEKNTK